MDPFRVLFVCSGNICRSALAEHVLRAQLAHIPTIQVGSAGTIATDGDRMPPQALALTERMGGTGTLHKARRVTASLLEGADLVLVAAREHRSLTASLAPRINRRLFTIRQFARLAEGLTAWDLAGAGLMPTMAPAERLRALVDVVASRRGMIAPDDPADDDVIDPFGRSDSVYEQSGRELAPAIDQLVASITLALTDELA